MPCLIIAGVLICILTAVAPGPDEMSDGGGAIEPVATTLTDPVGSTDIHRPVDPPDWDFAIENLAQTIALDMEHRYQRSLANSPSEPETISGKHRTRP